MPQQIACHARHRQRAIERGRRSRAPLHGVDPDRDLDGIRLRRLEALDFRQYQRPPDQPIEHVRLRIRRARRNLEEMELDRRGRVGQHDRLARDDGHDALDHGARRGLSERERKQQRRDHQNACPIEK